jgi:FlaA1/EpsC-like NDP-sugar epimerase
MRATNCLGELLVQYAARRSGRAYIVVRLGDILGSQGSVVPLFQEQIAAGGPVTVTHPDATRYFTSIPEAVRLVLQATVLGQGGEVFVLDMGEPMRLYDLAADLIRLHGLEPERDIRITFVGLRPGEKLHEVPHTRAECVRETAHPGIRVSTEEPAVANEELVIVLDELEHLARERRMAELHDLLDRIALRQTMERSGIA